jgi:hypothetical protein
VIKWSPELAKYVGRPTVAALTLLLGTALIVAGWLAERHRYLSSLLLQAGLTVLLVLPLLLLERLFEHRITESETRTAREVGGVTRDVEAVSAQLAETRRSLADLNAETGGRLKEAADAETALVAAARSEPNFETIRHLFRRADQLHAISDDGLRVGFPGQWERVRFRYLSVVAPQAVGGEPQPVFFLIIEDPTGKSTAVQIVWPADQSPADALVALADAWKRAGSYPGDAAIDAERIFGRLIDSLGVAISSRRTAGDGQLSPLVELLSPTWAMTDFGLEHVPMYYPIPRSELIKPEDLAHWRTHMTDKAWVNEENEDARATGEPDFWMVSELASTFFAAHAE